MGLSVCQTREAVCNTADIDGVVIPVVLAELVAERVSCPLMIQQLAHYEPTHNTR